MRGEGERADAVDDAALTKLINCAAAGDDPRATAELLPLVYAQLRRLAARNMRREPPGQTLQATALVHEAFLRVLTAGGGGIRGDADGGHGAADAAAPGQSWDGRWHFFAAAAEAMRRILVESARRRGRLKRGGDRRRVSLDNIDVSVDEPPEDLLALDEALAALAQRDPQQAKLVELRYFAGLTTEQAAEALGVSVRTAGRMWTYARAWLYQRITSS